MRGSKRTLPSPQSVPKVRRSENQTFTVSKEEIEIAQQLGQASGISDMTVLLQGVKLVKDLGPGGLQNISQVEATVKAFNAGVLSFDELSRKLPPAFSDLLESGDQGMELLQSMIGNVGMNMGFPEMAPPAVAGPMSPPASLMAGFNRVPMSRQREMNIRRLQSVKRARRGVQGSNANNRGGKGPQNKTGANQQRKGGANPQNKGGKNQKKEGGANPQNQNRKNQQKTVGAIPQNKNNPPQKNQPGQAGKVENRAINQNQDQGNKQSQGNRQNQNQRNKQNQGNKQNQNQGNKQNQGNQQNQNQRNNPPRRRRNRKRNRGPGGNANAGNQGKTGGATNTGGKPNNSSTPKGPAPPKKVDLKSYDIKSAVAALKEAARTKAGNVKTSPVKVTVKSSPMVTKQETASSVQEMTTPPIKAEQSPQKTTDNQQTSQGVVGVKQEASSIGQE